MLLLVVGRGKSPALLPLGTALSPAPGADVRGLGEGWSGSVFLEYPFPLFYPKVMSALDGEVCLLKPTES